MRRDQFPGGNFAQGYLGYVSQCWFKVRALIATLLNFNLVEAFRALSMIHPPPLLLLLFICVGQIEVLPKKEPNEECIVVAIGVVCNLSVFAPALNEIGPTVLSRRVNRNCGSCFTVTMPPKEAILRIAGTLRWVSFGWLDLGTIPMAKPPLSSAFVLGVFVEGTNEWTPNT